MNEDKLAISFGIIVGLALTSLLFISSLRHDKENNRRWDKCFQVYQDNKMPPETYTNFMKSCMDGDYQKD